MQHILTRGSLSTANFRCFLLILSGVLCCGHVQARNLSIARTGERSVIKIYVTKQSANYAMPWQPEQPSGGSGTGFIISKKRILTNAHLVADARFIQVQRNADSARYEARVIFIAHDCDLALLVVDDPKFYDGTRALRFATQLPALNDEVLVLGYPLGGQLLSVTKGVVSRLGYATYSHSAVDQHLVLQVDAAINPGNSGGPVFYGRDVVGLAFQGLSWADNIGYAIPLPVIRHFLDDVADGHYHGYPELGVAYLNLRNPALRDSLGLSPDSGGVVVHYIDPYGAAYNRLQDGDVLLSIDQHKIAADGTVQIAGEKYLFAEFLERKQWGDTVDIQVWRSSTSLRISVPLDNPPDPFVFRRLYDEQPEFLIVGGLVFTHLSRNYLNTVPRGSESPAVQGLFYRFDYAKRDGLYKDREAFVVLSQRLAHPVNAYLDAYQYAVVENANGKPIRHLRDLQDALEHPVDGYHVIRVTGIDETLVLDAAAAAAADTDIRVTYALPALRRIGGASHE